MTRLARLLLCLASLLLVGLLGVPAAHAQIGIEVVGLVAGVPAGGLSLPVGSPVPIQLQVIIERGSQVTPVAFDVIPTTDVRVVDGVIRNGQLIRATLVLQPGLGGAGFVAKKIIEQSTISLPGTLVDLPGGSLTIPPLAEQTVTLLLCGSSASRIPIVVTPRTEPQGGVTISNGASVEVDATILGGPRGRRADRSDHLDGPPLLN
jgi:hypothetical protein